jgi:hypothetical protein
MKSSFFSCRVGCWVSSALLMLSVSGGTFAEIYKCPDGITGDMVFTDHKCPNNRAGDPVELQGTNSDSGYASGNQIKDSLASQKREREKVQREQNKYRKK